jgi:membrane protease YdiL (CAAX protease family)
MTRRCHRAENQAREGDRPQPHEAHENAGGNPHRAIGLARAGTMASALAIQLALQVFAAAGAGALLAAHLRRCPERQSPVPAPVAPDLLWGAATYVAALPPLILAALLAARALRLLPNTPTPPNPGATLALGAHGPLDWVLLFLVAAVAAPITEELFFRGILYTLLRKSAGVPAALFLSGAAFALVHPQLPLGFLPILVLGVVFAAIVELRRSLVPSMAAHALNNAAVLLLISMMRSP